MVAVRAVVCALLAGCSFDGVPPMQAPVDAAPRVDAMPISACAVDGDYVQDSRSGITLRFDNDDRIRSEAADTCEAEGARLAILDTPGKRTFAGTLTGGVSRTYIGLQLVGDGWLWDDGSDVAMGQPPWANGKPNGGSGQPCGTLTDQGLFDDEVCDQDREFLCECL